MIRRHSIHRPIVRFLALGAFVHALVGCADHHDEEQRLAADALAALSNAIEYVTTPVFGAGESDLNPHLEALQILMDSSDNTSALLKLINAGSGAAKLYGLSGLYFVDYERYQRAISDLSESEENVRIVDGDIVSMVTISAAIHTPYTPPLRLEYGQLIDDWFEDGRMDGFFPDFAGGGYPMLLLDEGWMLARTLRDPDIDQIATPSEQADARKTVTALRAELRAFWQRVNR